MQYEKENIVDFFIGLFFLLTGCGKEIKQTNDSLTVYIGMEENGMLETAAGLFQAQYPEVEVTVIDGKKLTDEEMDAESLRLATELMAGEGPDVFCDTDAMGFGKNDKSRSVCRFITVL